MKRIFAALPVALFLLCNSTIYSQTNKLVFSPHWMPQAQFAGYYMAKEMGFYAEAGLDVEIIHPSATINAIEFLKSGQADVVSHFLVTAITARAEGIPMVNIAQLSQHSAIMLVSMKSSGIETIQDFEGRKIGVWMSGFEEVPKAMMIEHGLTVEFVPILWSVNLFLLGGLDLMTVMWYNEYNQLYLSGINHDELNTFFLKDYGYDIPEDGLYTLLHTLEQRPEDLRAFTEATLRGWEYVSRNKDAAIDLVIEKMRALKIPSNKAHQSWMLDRVLELLDPEDKDLLPGQLLEADFNLATGVLKERGIIKGSCSFHDFYKPVLPGRK